MNRLAPWLAAAAGLALTLLLFWPGYMSWDSAYQWWQSRHDQFDSVHPPLMAMIWQLTDRVVEGPGGMLALQAALLWSALAMFSAALPLRPAWRVVVVLLLGFWPPLFGLLAHIWKDLWTLAGFAWALALLAQDVRAPHRGWRAGAVLALVFACAFRHNAITGALPMLAWIAWREASAWGSTTSRFRLGAGAAITVLLACIVVLTAGIPSLDSRVRHTERVWSVVTLWDAAAVSLAEERLVYPPPLMDPSLTLDELRGKFVDYSNTSVFELGKLRHSFDGPYTAEQREALDALALALPREHTQAYFAHRWRLSLLLLGWHREALPDGLVFMPGLHVYGDNPPVEARTDALHLKSRDAMMAVVDTPFFAGWLYLLACVAVVAYAVIRFRRGNAVALAGVVALSSLAYALPLAIASGSAEFRYLAWPLLATLSSITLLLTNPVGGSSGPMPLAEKLRD